MSDFEQNRLTPRHGSSGTVWSLAAFSSAVFLVSVLGAKTLSRLVENDGLARSAYNNAMRDVAANQAQGPGVYSVRTIGVDGITTATIPLRAAPPVSPCGGQKIPGEAVK